MIRARIAPVKPRVFAAGGNDPLLLEDEVVRFLEAGARGLIAVLGPAGSGKTTALEHLSAVLVPAADLLLVDPLDEAPLPIIAPVRLVIYTAPSARHVRLEEHLAIYRLASWGKDDLIEYLLALHRPRCAAVMTRVQDGDYGLLDGVPELWRVVLDRLAEDDSLPDSRRALHRHLEGRLCDTDLLERTRSACLNAIVASDVEPASVLARLARPGFPEGLIRVLRHPAAQLLLAAERIAAELHSDGDCDFMAVRLRRDLVRTAATILATDPRAREHLFRLLDGPSWSHAMSVSLLHAAEIDWAPPHDATPMLAGAYLDGVSWSEVDLTGANLAQTDLSGADLLRANLTRANAWRADLSMARLHAATLNEITVIEADLTHADLTEVRASGGRFTGACLEQADCGGAVLRNAEFMDANLRDATFRGADLSGTRFVTPPAAPPAVCGSVTSRTQLDGADFTDANLIEAVLSGLCLHVAAWRGARFTRAKLNGCDLEFLNLPDADFQETDLRCALLTGSSMPGARFNLANLCGAGLADVEWEGVDLRGADLRGATFHMGSSRSGLVGSPIACEGSRTGFYTDDYDDQTYKPPEEIRKANLCGADLRGAWLEGVDFYLVDLRGALFDAEIESDLRRGGAIL